MTQHPHTKTQPRGIAMLLLTAFIWGSAFIAQSIGMERIDAFTFNGVRSILAALSLFPVVLIRGKLAEKKTAEIPRAEDTAAENGSGTPAGKRIRKHGVILGLVFFCASNLQQFAFYESTAGKIAFLTALYIFFVPLIGLPFGKHIPNAMWLCILAGFISLYFLCIRPGEDVGPNRGDVLAFLCSIFFAVHILLIERFTEKDDGLKLSFMQMAVCGTLSLVMMAVFETPRLSAILDAAKPLLYAGVLSGAVAYSFQILGQAYTEATLASLIMCMESVFALVAAAVVLHERMSGRELFGCALLLGAIVAGTLVSGKDRAAAS